MIGSTTIQMSSVFLEELYRFGSNQKTDKHLPHTGGNHVSYESDRKHQYGKY